MQKLLSTAVLALMYSWAFAASKEIEPGTTPPADQVDDVYVIIFGLLFGLIIFFFAYLWWGGRKKKTD